MMIKREPIKKSTVASAIALYGTLGGLLLNWRKKEIDFFFKNFTATHNYTDWTGQSDLAHIVIPPPGNMQTLQSRSVTARQKFNTRGR